MLPRIFESENQFCLILWAHEPVKSKDLVRLCQEQLGWKPTTTYTVIKRLSDRGVLKSENTIVTSLVSKDDVQIADINDFLERRFDGSLPDFLLAYSKHQGLSAEEITAVQSIIDEFGTSRLLCDSTGGNRKMHTKPGTVFRAIPAILQGDVAEVVKSNLRNASQ